MATNVGVLVVHGIGTQASDFADTFVRLTNARLAELDVPPGRVIWQPAYWADELNQRETDLWRRLSQPFDLDWVSVRRFFINVLADAVAYRYVPGAETGTYERIHRRIHDCLQNLRTALGGTDAPLIVVAHSLGSVILSNYIWDEQHRDPQRKQGRGGNAFERMETLTGLVTFGSNIPLFTLALGEADVQSIAFPPPSLPAALKAKATWLNFFDADDVLGYPLKRLSPSYGAAVSEDRAINVGNLFTSWNPVSHREYWEDGDFVGPVAALIREISQL